MSDLAKKSLDSFKSRASLTAGGRSGTYYSLPALEKQGLVSIAKLPYSIRVLLENILRNEDGVSITADHVRKTCDWQGAGKGAEVAFLPSRVVMQDFTGVPAVVDLAAMRDAISELGGNPDKVQPIVPADMVIDHSVQVDFFGTADAAARNAQIEFERNRERYEFLRWGQGAFENFRVVPPDTGIVHQVNLEYLSPVIYERKVAGEALFFPDSVVGTDSHTTMINGVGVFGWGVGGIEAEAVMLGQPYFMLMPQVIGFKLTGKLPEGATATDLVLTCVQMLRKKGVVDKFVEFFGPGLNSLPLADRATIANMAPEYGATMGFFPIDAQAIEYLQLSGRPAEQIALVEAYCKANGLWREPNAADPEYTDTLELDMGTVVPSVAGPKRPQDRVALTDTKSNWAKEFPTLAGRSESKSEAVSFAGQNFQLQDGAVVIAAITSCTNTSNPSVMIGAGLLAQKAVAKGLQVKPWVKTSLAPGSLVVTEYLKQAGLDTALDKLRFHTVGYGCTTCIGNSGPLPVEISSAVEKGSLVVAAALSGNRNFEGRINPHVKANYLASPPLVVAYALAGTVNIDFAAEPLGTGSDGKPVYLKDVWPTQQEIGAAMAKAVSRKLFEAKYKDVFHGDDNWRSIQVEKSPRYKWQKASTYIRQPTLFTAMAPKAGTISSIKGAKVLAVFGDSVTTDHISPAGDISKKGPAAKYLTDNGVKPEDFNSFGARRGNHEVMMRGTFANIRIKNKMMGGAEGGNTKYLPTGETMSIYDAAMKYQSDKTPLVVLAGKEYGTGSSRDWAAKGTFLLGIKAVIVESFERIHRSNLVGLGVLPLEFVDGASATSLGFDGTESFDIPVDNNVQPGARITVTATKADGSKVQFPVKVRLDTPIDVDYYRNGGILHYVLRQMAA